MEKDRKRLWRRIGVLGVLTVLCLIFGGANKRYLKGNPFDARFLLDNPSDSTTDEAGNVYVIDQSRQRVAAFTAEGHYLYEIFGGTKAENSFYSAGDIKAGRDGSLYLADAVLADDGVTVEKERIVKFDRNGKYVSTVYQVEYELDNRPVTTGRIQGMTLGEDGLAFVFAEADQVTLKKVPLEGGEAETLREIPYDTRYLISYGISREENRIYAVTKMADILELYDDGSDQVIYQGKEHDTEAFFSIPWQAAPGGDGTVYFTDIGLRNIGWVRDGGESGAALERADREDLGNNRIFYSLDLSWGDVMTAVADGEVYRLSVKTQAPAVIYGEGEGRISLVYSRQYTVWCCAVWAAVALGAVLVVILLFQLRLLKLHLAFSEMARNNLLIVTVAVIIAAVSVSTVMNSMEKQYRAQVMNNMCSVAELACNYLDPADVEQINTPQDYTSPAYARVRAAIDQVFGSSSEWNEGLYCVLNRVNENKIIYSCLYLEDTVGSVYPLDYDYEESDIYRSISDSGYGSEYKELYETGKQIRFDWIENTDGIWTYVLSPVFNEEGQVVAAMEVGTNLYAFQQTYQAAIRTIISNMVSIVAIIILVFTELSFVWLYRERRNKEVAAAEEPGTRSRELAIYVIRPMIFTIFMADCMATAFLPMLAGRLAVPLWGFPQEVMAAVPISTEVLFTAVFSFAGGFLVEKLGFRRILMWGGMLFTAGLTWAGFSGIMILFIGAKALIGTGMGFLLVGINSLVASCPEKESAEGFSFYNSGSQAGLTVGTTAGSLLAAAIGYLNVYFVAAAVSFCALLLIMNVLKKDTIYPKAAQEHKETAQGRRMTALQFLFDRELAVFFLCAMVPYMLYGYFLNYFLPLFAESQGLTETTIGQLFLINGVFVIYFGPFLTSYIAEKLKPRVAVVLAGAIYVGTLFLFSVFPGTAMAVMVPLLFGIADSFGFSALSLYFSGLNAVKSYGTGRAMGVYSTFDNISQTVGPFVFSAVFVMGIRRGVLVLAAVYVGLLAVYVVFGKKAVGKR